MKPIVIQENLSFEGTKSRTLEENSMSTMIAYVAHWDSREIAVLQLDAESGKLSVIERMGVGGVAIPEEFGTSEGVTDAVHEPRGMPLAISPDKRFLYASLRSEPYSVVSFSISPASGKLTYLATTPLADSMTCLATDRSGRFLLGASYSGNTVTVSPIGPDGIVQSPATQILATPPKTHCVLVDLSNRFLLAACLGGDVLISQSFDAATGILSPLAASTLSMPPGAGPRHFVFHPSGRFLYLLCELDGSVQVCSFSQDRGKLSHVQVVSALPPSLPGKPWASDIHITPDGRFLYAAERRSNTLVAFLVDAKSGKISRIASYPTELMPRAFNIDPRGQFLLAVGQVSNSLTVYSIGSATGRLVERERYPVGQNPSWVEIIEINGGNTLKTVSASKRKSVVVYKQIPDILLSRLLNQFDVTYFTSIHNRNRRRFIDAIRDAHGLLGSSVKLPESLLNGATNLEVISTISVGVDNFDLDYLNRRRILLAHTPHVATEATADTVFSLVMATARRVVELAEFVKAGHWRRSIDEPHYGVNVHSKTIGVLGMGRIGRAVARRAHKGFGMRVLYHSRSPAPDADMEFHAKAVSLDVLLREADFVCVLLPLTPETRRIFGEEEFALMRPNSIFINGSRGGVVDEEAMIAALQRGGIRAAGLDVFDQEPLSTNSPLLKMPNVVALPHVGSATHETRFTMAQLAVDNLIAGLNGWRPQYLANEPFQFAREKV